MKTPHIIPLSKQAVEVLRALKLLTGNGKLVLSTVIRENQCRRTSAVLPPRQRFRRVGLRSV
jgi:hypothetical protein